VKLIFGFLRSREIIGQLSDYQLFTEDPGSWSQKGLLVAKIYSS
jgi:hypothetical protein